MESGPVDTLFSDAPTLQKITVLIPCYNEADGIANVIHSFPRALLAKFGFQLEVIVIDNNSTDNTAEIASSAGARVVFEANRGKGNAVRTGMRAVSADTDYVVMLDGDATYRGSEVLRLVEPLASDFCEVIIGSRLSGRVASGGMRGFNRLGNWIFSHLVRYFYRVNVTDTLTGYFAWKKTVIDQLWPHLESAGFAIEMEMITKMARLGHDIYSVPISYEPRAGESSLRPLRDGARILGMFMQNLTWSPAIPLKEWTPAPRMLSLDEPPIAAETMSAAVSGMSSSERGIA